MSILKATVWNGAAVGVRLSTGLVLNKILAVLVGPPGYAIIGQFQNAVMILFTVSAGAINNGVVKYTADHEGDPRKQAQVWSTAVWIVVVTSTVIGLLVALFHRSLAVHFLGNAEFSTVFLWLAGSILLFTLNTLFLSILSGKKDVRTYVLSNIAGSALILVAMALLTWEFGLYGALVAMAINQASVFFVTVWLCWDKAWVRRDNILGPFSRPVAINLIMFAVMAAVSAISNNLGQVAVRYLLVTEFGIRLAGYWDGMIKISQVNMLLVATTMSFYCIPRMAELTYWEDIKQEVWDGCKIIMPIFAVGALAAYVLRDLVIALLFTRDFLPMQSLFVWQLAGDTVRVASWFLAYVMIGRAMILIYALTEILTNLLFLTLGWWFTRLFGFEGVAVAHLVTYSIAIIGMYVAIDRAGRLPRRLDATRTPAAP